MSSIWLAVQNKSPLLLYDLKLPFTLGARVSDRFRTLDLHRSPHAPFALYHVSNPKDVWRFPDSELPIPRMSLLPVVIYAHGDFKGCVYLQSSQTNTLQYFLVYTAITPAQP